MPLGIIESGSGLLTDFCSTELILEKRRETRVYIRILAMLS